MAGYTFETMSQDDAASFKDGDLLTFSTDNSTASQVVAASTDPGFGGSATSLTFLGKTLIFPADAISDASLAGRIGFQDSSHIIIGTGETNTLTIPEPLSPATTPASVAFGLAGSDIINGQDGNNYLYGGTDETTSAQLNGGIATAGMGGDTINAGDGNNHIYGLSLGAVQGSQDGNDTIEAGAGSNYINGNAGNDEITVGVDDSVGANRVFGGSGDDMIILHGAGNYSVNGNMGDDTIDASDATSPNAFLQGGKGNDTILASQGQDTISGNNDSDHLVAGTGSGDATDGTYGHLTIMVGGTGADTFDFHADDAGNAGFVQDNDNGIYSGIDINGTTFYQTISDFHSSENDTIVLPFSVGSDDIVYGQAGVSATSVAGAQVYAQQLLDNHTVSADGTGEVAAINVNGDAYLFYDSTGGDGGTINSIIHLTGVDAGDLSQAGTQPTFTDMV